MAVVLVAEDNPDVARLLQVLLTRAGFEVMCAADGVEALDLARSRHPDLVLTDLDMPRLNGLDLCRAIRTDPELRELPVAVLSGSLYPGDPRATEVTLCGVLLKPFLNADLVAAVRRLIEHGSHDHTVRPSLCPLVTDPLTSAGDGALSR